MTTSLPYRLGVSLLCFGALFGSSLKVLAQTDDSAPYFTFIQANPQVVDR